MFTCIWFEMLYYFSIFMQVLAYLDFFLYNYKLETEI